MDVAAIWKVTCPQLPNLLSTGLSHALGQSETSSKWDLRTTLTVQFLRNMMKPAKPSPISRVQGLTQKDPGIKGKIWVAKAVMKAPKPQEEDIRDAVFQAIEDMKLEGTTLDYTRPELADIEVEWTGSRPKAGAGEALPNLSEEEKYQNLMTEPSRTSETTVLYFHGGAYYLADPITHRELCRSLAAESGARVCSTRYRLAPQAAFPSQLLDALMCYLSLLHPPAGSLHGAVLPKQIVLAGDSAGGNLAFALLQLLLQLHRSGKTKLVFYGKTVDVPLPAGVAANSGWFDITRSMPSLSTNQKFDYLPAARHDDQHTRWPTDSVWPTNPPRGDLFVDLSLFDHPLVSVVGADSWKDSPPLFFITGQEMLQDEDRVVASRAAQQGVTVHYEEYEAMFHVFCQIMPTLPQSTRCLKSWGDFCRRCVEEPETLRTNGTYVPARGAKEETRDVENLTDITLDAAREFMKDAKERRIKGYDKEGAGTSKPAL